MNERPARPGETCTCGRPAVVVFITEKFGAVPYCGIPGVSDTRRVTTMTIPYTHWAYFADRGAAEACGAELDQRFDCLTAVDPTPDPIDDPALDDTIAAVTGERPRPLAAPRPWLLRASRTVVVDRLEESHNEVEQVVQRHGGHYDGGESGWLPIRR